MTQTEKIVKYMRDFGSITTMQAFLDLGVTRLASRISELEKSGVAISREFVDGRNRYGEKVRYKRYWLEV